MLLCMHGTHLGGGRKIQGEADIEVQGFQYSEYPPLRDLCTYNKRQLCTA